MRSSSAFVRYCIAGLFASSLFSASVSIPIIPFIGVRISCDIRERKVVLERLLPVSDRIHYSFEIFSKLLSIFSILLSLLQNFIALL